MDLHIKDVLRKYIKEDKRVGDAYYTQKIQEFWTDRLGESIDSRTSNLYFTRGVLKVKMNSAPLRHELFNSREKLIEKVNEFLGEDVVHKIDFS